MQRISIQHAVLLLLMATLLLSALPAKAQSSNDQGQGVTAPTENSLVVDIGAQFPLALALRLTPSRHFAMHFSGFVTYLASPHRSGFTGSAFYRSPIRENVALRVGPTATLISNTQENAIGAAAGLDYQINERLTTFADVSLSTFTGGRGGVSLVGSGIGVTYRISSSH